MFHYRLATANNRSRLLIAVFLALAVHMVLMSFEFVPKQVFVPSVSLPRSVSILLRQRSTLQTPDQPVKKTQTVSPVKEEQLTAEKKPELPAHQKIPAVQEKSENLFEPPDLLKKTAPKSTHIAEKKSKPVVEDSVSSYEQAEEVNPATDKAAKVKNIDTQAEPQAAQEAAGTIMPGTVQLAYPRYQLNTPPAYPGLSRKRGQEGTVILQVLVNREGGVDKLKIDVSSKFSLLDSAALTAVKKWSFEPGKRGEQKVPMWVRVPVTFKLKK
jgi:protein TonB